MNHSNICNPFRAVVPGDQYNMKRKERCSGEGCTNQALKGGVCWRHGARRKLCSTEGYTNIVVKGGVCRRHEKGVVFVSVKIDK